VNTTKNLPFTVSDEWVPADNLGVTAYSFHTDVVPQANVALGGSGNNRTLTLTPATDKRGLAAISVQVNNGSANVFRGLVLGVGIIPGDTNFDGVVDLGELNSVIQSYRHPTP
jgi:hypothetical protein